MLLPKRLPEGGQFVTSPLMVGEMVGMAGRYTGSYLDRCNGWRAIAILG
jgi:hypothetical protein